jgi:hypothetical protein
MNASQMEQVLQQLVELTNLVYSKEPHWGVSAMELMPPAEDQEITILSGESPFPLPASYVQFLKLHNGCLNFWLRSALLGTKGEPRDLVRKAIEDAREFLSELAADEQGRLTAASIAEFETPTDITHNYFLPHHLVFGASGGGQFYLFDEKQRTPDGEYEVVHYTYDGGARYRYPDFPSFLTSSREQLEKRIDQKGYRSTK